MHLQVVVQSDAGAQRTELYPASGPLTIGRHPQCSLRLDSDLVSRQHAVVSAGHGALRVEDVSTNGTIAGDLLLRRDSVEVPYGTPIVVGDFTVFVYALDQQGNPIGPTAAQIQQSDTRQRLQGQSGSNPGMNGRGPVPTNPRGSMTTSAVPIPNVSGMNPVIAHVGSQPGPKGVHLPARGEDDKLKAEVALRREIHKLLLEHLDLATIDAKKLDDPSMRPKVLNALRRIIAQIDARIPPEMDRDGLIGELADEALGLGPLERFLSDGTITEIMVVDPNTIYIEQGGKILLSQARFTDDERVRAVIERIVTPLGRRIDESSPLVDARLKDGSRVNAVIRPIALRGSCITIRKFSKVPLTLDKLVNYGSITERMGRFLTRCVHAKKNIVISGGTGSGKTTLLNVLSGAIPEDERIVTIEDAAELQLKQPHVVSMETRPANLEGRGEYTIRDLVKNALRMRPDRIVVGECRGGEALDMLQAMNTGHDGSLTTTHANSPPEAISRLETLVLMAGVDLPLRAIRDQISAAVHIIVQQSRLSDGSRKVTAISEVTGIDSDTTEIELRPIFEFIRTGTGPKGQVVGEYRATGYLPSFLQTFIVMGLVKKGEPYI
ncbi:MAG: Flp pilus assembly complex ATPase component TadA [Labilithrix sp.]|nr:Flp pilus assembly complex ATPase component TadA [Labilithrix sp.]MBX3224950.1 Flp pilus assembly complex ATPase component TadA [Labilithrix sp.]